MKTRYITFTLIAVLLLAAILFPVYYMFEVSLKPQGSLATTGIELIPENATLSNYGEELFGHREGTARGDSALIKAERATIKRGDRITNAENCTIAISGGVTIDLFEPEILESRGGEAREGGLTIVNGDSIRIMSKKQRRQ